MVLLAWLRKNWLRLVVHVGALLPLAWGLWHAANGLFLVDPIKEITTLTGRSALILLILSLACTPLNTLLNYYPIIRVRRALGVYAFLYAALHFLTFVGLDYAFDLGLVGAAIFEQLYVVVGFSAGLILLVLALTSTRGWQRRLRKNWKRIHRLVYLAAPLVIVHYVWLSKDWREPLRYGAVVALLLALRLPWIRASLGRARRRAAPTRLKQPAADDGQ
jgi:sulfoxide reductase heme-binding subunit YedZ